VLFVLSEELLPFCSNEGTREIEGIQNLLLSVRQGRHALSGKKAVFASLSKNQSLSERERATARSLANRSSELPILESAVKHKILVSPNPLRKISKVESDFSWEIDVKELGEKFLESLVILAENKVDAELFQYAALHHQISKQIKGVSSRSYAQGGGGSQIDVELKGLLDKGTPVVAITDGDFLFPGMDQSIISIRCTNLIEQQASLGWHYTLPVREVENIIPISILSDVADASASQKALDFTQQAAAVSTKIGSQPCEFSCFKKGATLSKIFKSENHGERSYWLQVADAIKQHRSHDFQRCLDQNSCPAADCKCHLSHGFGENILKQVKHWLAERSPHKSHEVFRSSKVWMSVGEMVFDASIAFRPANI